MTHQEYDTKLAMIVTSDASVTTKEVAIAELKKKFLKTSSTDEACKKFEESSADTSDIGGSF